MPFSSCDTRKSLSTTSKNDPHLEELTISIAMDNTELLITNVYIPRPVIQWELFTTNRPLADRHRFTTMNSDHLPILIGLQTTATSSPARHRTYINFKKADCARYRQEMERKLSSRHLPTDCQKDEKLFRATLLKAASHHIPTGRRKLYMQQVPAEILAMMDERDDLCKQDPASPRLSTMNDEITKVTWDHKRRQWREFVESIDHRTDSTKLWRTIKGIDGRK